MKIVVVTPAPPGSRHGNRYTAARWTRLLRGLGHRVDLQHEWNGKPADLMIALHARRSHSSLSRFKQAHPRLPLVLALTGTDLYRDIKSSAVARESMRLADRMIVLQERGLRELPFALRGITHVIYQSAPPPPPAAPLKSCFEVVVSGHLRDEKDPFRAATALRHVPEASRIRITHIGGAMSTAMASQAAWWMRTEPRYRWLGELSHGKAMRILSRSRLMVISSRMEGGANVVSEALAAGIPVVASRISGNVGMLGERYAGYFPATDERALARLLLRAEQDVAFYRRLQNACASRSKLVTPARESASLKQLLAGLAPQR